MNIDIRAGDLTPTQAREMSTTVRNALRDVGHRIARVVVRVSALAGKRHAARNCVIEVHMTDGHVEYVEERQRRLGSALRRAVRRAWQAAARWVALQLPKRQTLRLPRRQTH
ncbi:hypothetical protein [Caenimonas koreensis]|uniref:Sigma 54 modulation protein / S30EA ribosomal protein n=1 Tax=Caenimonas koreensis DSM 17982 TaxID=1121255 RepID=A0A844B668_9BURK|nr:hypothetical protein [Caenimonas koreensis]MRD46041.1 hypothetical protein [Caenimonas koreensis DSM 17982]